MVDSPCFCRATPITIKTVSHLPINKEFKVAPQLAAITNSISCYIYRCTVFHQLVHHTVMSAPVLHRVQHVRQVMM